MQILGREGEDRIMAGIFYVWVVKVVLMFGSDTWVMTPHLEKSLEIFHHRVVRQMVVMGPKRQQYVTWMYPQIVEAMATVGIDEIIVYITRRQKTVAKYIATCTIMNLCLEAERMPGLRLYIC